MLTTLPTTIRQRYDEPGSAFLFGGELGVLRESEVVEYRSYTAIHSIAAA